MGMVFDIQRFSINDGPGIRTSVFLKGCNLRCAWCHNPESISPLPQSMDDRICGVEMDSEQVMSELCKDADFYKNSGGGVTLTGGEPLMQPEFTLEILKKCRAAGFHTVVDTAGNVDFTVFESVLPYCDLFLFDIKAADGRLHQAGTGADNARILENLKRLRAPKWIRIPIIPGFNDAPKELESIAGLIRALDQVERICLLPFHALGFRKYKQLDMENPCSGLKSADSSALGACADYFSNIDVPVQIC